MSTAIETKQMRVTHHKINKGNCQIFPMEVLVHRDTAGAFLECDVKFAVGLTKENMKELIGVLQSELDKGKVA